MGWTTPGARKGLLPETVLIRYVSQQQSNPCKAQPLQNLLGWAFPHEPTVHGDWPTFRRKPRTRVQDAQPPAAACFIATRIPWSCEEGTERDTRQEMSCFMDAMLQTRTRRLLGSVAMILAWGMAVEGVGSTPAVLPTRDLRERGQLAVRVK